MSILKLPPMAYAAIALAPVTLYTLALVLTPMTWTSGMPFMWFAMAWGGVFSIVHWVRMDEAAKEAQKFALFWGAVAGTGFVFVSLLAFPGFVAFVGDRVEATLAAAPQSPMRPSTYGFVIGATYLCLAQVIGFLVFWTGWWIAKR